MCILKDRMKINEVSIQLKKLETALVKKKKKRKPKENRKNINKSRKQWGRKQTHKRGD